MHSTRKDAQTKKDDTTTPYQNDREEKSKKGIRKRIEVMVSKLRHDSFRTKLRRGVHFLITVCTLTSIILAVPELMNRVSNRTTDLQRARWRGKLAPNSMVQLVRDDDCSRARFIPKRNVNGEALKRYRSRYRHYKNGHGELEEGNCRAMHPWQLQAYPTCNVLHETDMSKPSHVGRGGFRDVWVMEEWDGTQRAVKTLADRKDFAWREYDRHRRDALAMSLLTSSKHIPNIYGYCKCVPLWALYSL